MSEKIHTQPKHKCKSFSCSIFHCSVFGYRTKHCLLFNNYIRSSCFDTSWSTALGVWYVTSQCWLTYISLLGFWLSDKAFVLFDLLVLGVCISDETLLLVFDNSRCLDIRWNTPPRVWYVSSRCLDIRWYIVCSFSCLIILGVWIPDETLLLVFDILLLGVWISDDMLLLVFDI